MKLRTKEGFSLIELLVVLGIIAVLMTLSVGIYFSLEQRNQLDIEAQKITSFLRLAQNQTQAAENFESHGIYFDSIAGTYTLFSGSSFDPMDPANEVINLEATLQFSDIQLVGGGADVIFSRISGNTSQNGFIEVSEKNDASQNRIICVEASGSVRALPTGRSSSSCSTSPSPPGLIDSRHLEFDLGFSLRTHTNIALTFGGSVVETVTIVDFMNIDSTIFDWEGAVDVFGSEQIIRIHSLYIDDFDTILSIRRDRRFNDASLVIDIDSINLVSYTADGEATKGFGIESMIAR